MLLVRTRTILGGFVSLLLAQPVMRRAATLESDNLGQKWIKVGSSLDHSSFFENHSLPTPYTRIQKIISRRTPVFRWVGVIFSSSY